MTTPGDELLFLALGGAGEIGMNLNLYGHAGKWLMVDLGITFGDERTPGIEIIMPDPGFVTERLDELSRACADIMLHQVALLNGVAAGARELLQELSPTAIQHRHGGLLHALLRPFGYDRRWSAFRQRFEDLQEETALTSRLLGRAFARAYAASMGLGSGQLNRPSSQDGALPVRTTDRS